MCAGLQFCAWMDQIWSTVRNQYRYTLYQNNAQIIVFSRKYRHEINTAKKAISTQLKSDDQNSLKLTKYVKDFCTESSTTGITKSSSPQINYGYSTKKNSTPIVLSTSKKLKLAHV